MSGSTDLVSGWRAGAWVYSGRENPSWPLDDRQVECLLALWENLPLASRTMPARSEVDLGYRGCWFGRESSGVWSAAGDQVTCTNRSRTESRFDAAQRLESAVLATAPPGLLPRPLP